MDADGATVPAGFSIEIAGLANDMARVEGVFESGATEILTQIWTFRIASSSLKPDAHSKDLQTSP